MHMNDYSKITALYSRLSVGDEDRDGGESNSIQNQKKFLESYARQLKLTNIRHYIDDDESGRFFDRSAYSRMIEDVENGKVGVCIMKDMTRWRRDYLQVGNAIRTERGDLNREIEVTNQKLRQLKARISKLQNWLKEESENTEPPTLADYIQGILSRKAQAGKSGYSQSLYNLKDAAKMLNFLQANNIMDMTGLDEKFKSMIGEQLDIQGKLKPVERRLGTLKKHLEQADIYFKCKGKKPLTEAEQILFTTAKDYLKGVMNGKTTIPTKTWKEEYTKLTAERKTLNQRYLALKEEVKEAEKIRKSVYSILRQEQREQQPRRKQDMER